MRCDSSRDGLGCEAKVERREIVADKLEKTRSLELLAGRVIYHR